MARNHGHNLFYFLTNLHITLKYGSNSKYSIILYLKFKLPGEHGVEPTLFAQTTRDNMHDNNIADKI